MSLLKNATVRIPATLRTSDDEEERKGAVAHYFLVRVRGMIKQIVFLLCGNNRISSKDDGKDYSSHMKL